MSNGESTSGSSHPEGQDREGQPPPAVEPTELDKKIQEAGSKCLQFVQRFKDGEITKTLATVNITATIRGVPGITARAVTTALESYYNMLDEFASSQKKASERGRVPREDDGTDDDDEHDRDGGNGGKSPPQIRRDRSRSRSGSPEPKRRKTVPDADQPWLIDSIINEASLRPELRKTLQLLRSWSADPKGLRFSIINSADCPEFPFSEWTNIIAGKAISLDQVLSAMYTTISDNRSTHKVGGIEIVSEAAAQPTKIVRSHGEWAAAWQKAQAAYIYVMPHRAEELRKYGDHISQLFSAFGGNNHGRIINYDKAVRTLIASRRNVTLGDYHEFQALRIAHLDHHGSGNAQASGSGAKVTEAKPKSNTSKRRSETCHRHNNGTCPGSCGRLHACNLCRDPTHVEADCPKSGGKK
jgi:hypothetical protein